MAIKRKYLALLLAPALLLAACNDTPTSTPSSSEESASSEPTSSASESLTSDTTTSESSSAPASDSSSSSESSSSSSVSLPSQIADFASLASLMRDARNSVVESLTFTENENFGANSASTVHRTLMSELTENEVYIRYSDHINNTTSFSYYGYDGDDDMGILYTIDQYGSADRYRVNAAYDDSGWTPTSVYASIDVYQSSGNLVIPLNTDNAGRAFGTSETTGVAEGIISYSAVTTSEGYSIYALVYDETSNQVYNHHYEYEIMLDSDFKLVSLFADIRRGSKDTWNYETHEPTSDVTTMTYLITDIVYVDELKPTDPDNLLIPASDYYVSSVTFAELSPNEDGSTTYEVGDYVELNTSTIQYLPDTALDVDSLTILTWSPLSAISSDGYSGYFFAEPGEVTISIGNVFNYPTIMYTITVDVGGGTPSPTLVDPVITMLSGDVSGYGPYEASLTLGAEPISILGYTDTTMTSTLDLSKVSLDYDESVIDVSLDQGDDGYGYAAVEFNVSAVSVGSTTLTITDSANTTYTVDVTVNAPVADWSVITTGWNSTFLGSNSFPCPPEPTFEYNYATITDSLTFGTEDWVGYTDILIYTDDEMNMVNYSYALSALETYSLNTELSSGTRMVFDLSDGIVASIHYDSSIKAIKLTYCGQTSVRRAPELEAVNYNSVTSNGFTQDGSLSVFKGQKLVNTTFSIEFYTPETSLEGLDASLLSISCNLIYVEVVPTLEQDASGVVTCYLNITTLEVGDTTISVNTTEGTVIFNLTIDDGNLDYMTTWDEFTTALNASKISVLSDAVLEPTFAYDGVALEVDDAHTNTDYGQVEAKIYVKASSSYLETYIEQYVSLTATLPYFEAETSPSTTEGHFNYLGIGLTISYDSALEAIVCHWSSNLYEA